MLKYTAGSAVNSIRLRGGDSGRSPLITAVDSEGLPDVFDVGAKFGAAEAMRQRLNHNRGKIP
jgi:hypothetical protein